MNENADTLHRQLWDLIPWVAADTASDSDRLRVQQHLAGCDDCRHEMAFHCNLVRGMQAGSPTAAHDSEPGLQRLLARIEVAQRPSQQAGAVMATDRPARWLMAAVLVQAIGLATLAGVLLQSRQEASYQTLSTPEDRAARAVSLRLVPDAKLPAGQLATLLSQHGLQIVESSSDGTVLGLARQTGAPPDTPASLQALAAQLRAVPGVLLAEPNPSHAGR